MNASGIQRPRLEIEALDVRRAWVGEEESHLQYAGINQSSQHGSAYII